MPPIAPIAPRIQPKPARPVVRTSVNPAIVTRASHERAIAAQGNPVSDVLKSLRKGIQWLFIGPTVDRFSTRRVEENPDTRHASPSDVRQAVTRLRANQAVEAAALKKLGTRAAAYQKIAATLQADPVAREALQKMLLDGRLTGAKDLRGQGDMLNHLTRLQEGPLASGLDRVDLLTNLVEEVEHPVKIAQEEKGTCVATAATIVLVQKNPAEYLRLIADLATPAGMTETMSGKVLKRKPDWDNNNDGNRTPSARLLQPALMELGNGFWRYNNDRDVHTLPLGNETNPATQGFGKVLTWLGSLRILPGGLTVGGANKVLESLTGADYKGHDVYRFNRNRLWQRIENALAAGHVVPAGLSWNDGGHKILMEAIRDNRVYYINPWGQRESMALAEFKQNLKSANLPG